jgi:two-component system, cell cycle sensor histidine kinase and response regulator CckA
MRSETALRILFVEDVPFDAELAERELRREGFIFTSLRAETKEDFLDGLQRHQPDLIISDYSLPEFDGLQALTLSLEHDHDLPFIILTGSLNEETAVSCLKSGAWDYILKENTARLPHAVRSALDQRADRLAKREAEVALMQSEERYRSLVENLRDEYILYKHNSQGIIEYVSPSITNILGYTEDEFLRHYSTFLTDNPMNQASIVLTEKAMAGEQQPPYLVEVYHKNREIRTLRVTENPVLDHKGEVVGVSGIAHDITKLSQMEAERERLVSAIEQAAEIVVITDAKGTIQYVNPAFETVTGYSRQEAVGKNPNILKSGLQDAAFYRSMWQTLTAGKTWNGIFINKKKDGVQYTEEATISPVRDATGNIVNYVATKRDVTDQLRIAEEKEQLEAQYLQAQKMEAVGRLAGGVAHDFNNMLQAILGYCFFAMGQTTEGDPLRKDLEEIQTAAERSADLTRQLLAFARKQTVNPQVLDLNETVSGMLKMLQRLIGEDIDLAWIQRQNLWQVRLDPSQIDQILANLTVNARDAIDGVGKVTIETTNTVFDEDYCSHHMGFSPGEFVCLAVSDDGCGMDRETVDHIFEPFFTTKGIGEGTGLGLATVYGIVKQNGGFINVYSEPENGTSFHIYLPRYAEDPQEDLQTAAAAPLIGGQETVLIVEDEDSVLLLAKRILEELGYTVLSASMPSLAIALVSDHPGRIDLLVTDVVMPEMNGRELVEKLTVIKPEMKQLYMSGYTANVIAHRGVLDEGVHFIQKPFAVEMLAAKVREALDER